MNLRKSSFCLNLCQVNSHAYLRHLRDTPKRVFCASAESEASAFRKLPNQKLRQKLWFLPKLLYLTAASAISTESAIRKIVELHWSTSERLLNISFYEEICENRCFCFGITFAEAASAEAQAEQFRQSSCRIEIRGITGKLAFLKQNPANFK